MQKYIVIAVSVFAAACIFSHSAHAGGSHSDAEVRDIRLSAKFRRLLSAEMNALQRGMNNLVIAVPAGKWEEIAEISKKMPAGYIVKKKLSKKEMEEFNSALPSGYRSIDKEFRDAAEGLADAALKHDSGRVISYLCKISESCAACHNQYARERFPGFKSK